MSGYTYYWIVDGLAAFSTINYDIILDYNYYNQLPIAVIFSLGVCMMWLCLHMLLVSFISRESCVLFLYYWAIVWCALWPDARVYLFAHYFSSLPSSCRRIWRYWTSKMLVPKIKLNLSIIFDALFGAVCIHLTHFPDDDCENMCTLSYYHNQTWSMTHLPLFRVSFL